MNRVLFGVPHTMSDRDRRASSDGMLLDLGPWHEE